jgi:WD40 repeat protein
MKFSPDGRYLATGGQDCKVIVWSIGHTSSSAEVNTEEFYQKQSVEQLERVSSVLSCTDMDPGSNMNGATMNGVADGGGGGKQSPTGTVRSEFINPTPEKVFIGHTGMYTHIYSQEKC